MTEAEKIEEIARAMCEPFEPSMQGQPCTVCKTYERNCHTIHKAKLLIEAGFGNVEQAVREFAEEIKTAIENDSQADREAFGKSAFKEGFYNALLNLIDERIQELYGK